VNALALGGDEGRVVAAISLGEPPDRLRSGDVRMGKPTSLEVSERKRTQGSEISQYLEENKSFEIPVVVRANWE
jgi:hypothetical protein